MKNNYEGPYKERLIAIDDRIEGLSSHRTMWGKAGSERMAMQASQEIIDLRAEKMRILNGSQEKIDKLQIKINELKELKAQ